ncbi:MAG: 50S ribosomal protein L16 [Candidatus Blackburnbacteria bacterium]|nr:50S ribosomal protein L16 [Candidatus Blackburnbacteria bacterium]
MQPKSSKYRKQFRGRRRGISTRGAKVDFGEWGLKSLSCGWLTAKQIEAARRAIAHTTSRGGKVWLRVFPHKPVSGRGAGVRMGGGKGDIVEHVAVVRPGRILFEIAGVSEELAHEAFDKASAKLPFPTVIVQRG